MIVPVIRNSTIIFPLWICHFSLLYQEKSACQVLNTPMQLDFRKFFYEARFSDQNARSQMANTTLARTSTFGVEVEMVCLNMPADVWEEKTLAEDLSNTSWDDK